MPSAAMRTRDDAPLGVFDSGLGGLTVVGALRRRLPDEAIVYLGDTARVPYGTRSAETVVRYARGCARVLVDRGVKALVVACGTVSAVALDALRVEFDLPVLGVIEPSARLAVERAAGGVIGVLGTPGTIASGAYPRAIAAFSTRSEVVARAAPLFVPLAEEGWVEGDVPRLAARRYLEPLVRAGARVIVLGCTHYPLLEPAIAAEAGALAGGRVDVIDTGSAVADEVARFLDGRGLRRGAAEGAAGLEVLVTDLPGGFAEVAGRFLGEALPEVRQIDLGAARTPGPRG
jgi:glutamate racemase